MTTVINGTSTSASAPAVVGDDGDTGVYFPSANTLALSAGGTQVSTINAYGIGLGAGTTPSSGMGITFPGSQSASSNANTLDDYEEGTWTPVIAGTGGNPTITYDSQIGFYQKVGNSVKIVGYVQTSARTGGSGSLAITGLPFAQQATAAGLGGSALFYAINAGISYCSIYCNGAASQTFITLLASSNQGSNWTDTPISGIPNSLAAIRFEFTYII